MTTCSSGKLEDKVIEMGIEVYSILLLTKERKRESSRKRITPLTSNQWENFALEHLLKKHDHGFAGNSKVVVGRHPNISTFMSSLNQACNHSPHPLTLPRRGPAQACLADEALFEGWHKNHLPSTRVFHNCQSTTE